MRLEEVSSSAVGRGIMSDGRLTVFVLPKSCNELYVVAALESIGVRPSKERQHGAQASETALPFKSPFL